MHRTAFVYRLEAISASSLLAGCLLVAVAIVGSGCRSAPASKPGTSLEGKSDSEILYHAALESFRDRGLEVAVASEKFLIVTSEYEPIEERLRRRFTARIVRLDGGATALRVRAEHQRRHGSGEGAVWKKVESELLRKRAKPEELELGRAIERRFRRWRDQRDETESEQGRSDAG